MQTSRINWSRVISSALRSAGPFFTVGGAILTFLAWKLAPATKVDLWVFVLVVAVLVFAVWTLLLAVLAAIAEVPPFRLMDLDDVIPVYPPHNDAKAMFVAKPGTPLVLGFGVIFLRCTDKFEMHVGTGSVRQVHTDGSAQISLDRTYGHPDIDEFVASLLDGNDENRRKGAMAQLKFVVTAMPTHAMRIQPSGGEMSKMQVQEKVSE